MQMIKQCPFCGRDVKIHQDGYYMAPVIRHATSGKDCVFSTLVFYNRDMEKAVELWNRRAEDVVEGMPSAQPEKRTDERMETHACDLPSAQPTQNNTSNALESLDCISRTTAIDQLHQSYNLLDAEQRLNELPSAQPYTDEEIQKMQDIEQAQLDKAYEMGNADALRWIPCSERLPEHAGAYLVTTTVAVEKYVISSWYSPKGGWMCEDHPEAWMLLPEPYKEDDDE